MIFRESEAFTQMCLRSLFRETIARANFKRFISKNKEYFEGIIDYTADRKNVDVSISILDNQQIKTCKFDTFNSKTGGRFCIVEVAQIIAEMFGVSNNAEFTYLSEKVKKPVFGSKDKLFVMLSPELCNSAVDSGAELYNKVFLQGKYDGSFRFINIPLGPNAKETIKQGIEVTEISN